MAQQIAVNPAAVTGQDEGRVIEIAPDVAYRRLGIVNVTLIGTPGGDWVLVDAGVFGTAPLIRGAAADRFGAAAPPKAIVLTHGHFDHVGALATLADEWDVPILAHRLEFPYLDGRAAYPPPDPSVGGGLMALLSPLFPKNPVDVSRRLQALPDDGTMPFLPDWRAIHTPGHAPGHVSLWRQSDRLLVAGDAFITTAQESAYAVARQSPELHGPPKYFTPDWDAARQSVRTLAVLQPNVVVTGHGPAMAGEGMRDALDVLARDFDSVAVPTEGRYVHSR